MSTQPMFDIGGWNSRVRDREATTGLTPPQCLCTYSYSPSVLPVRVGCACPGVYREPRTGVCLYDGYTPDWIPPAEEDNTLTAP